MFFVGFEWDFSHSKIHRCVSWSWRIQGKIAPLSLPWSIVQIFGSSLGWNFEGKEVEPSISFWWLTITIGVSSCEKKTGDLQYICIFFFSEWDLSYSYKLYCCFWKQKHVGCVFVCWQEGSCFFLQDVLCWQSLPSVGIGGYQQQNYLVVSNILFHPFLGRWSNLTNIFQLGWFNHQLENHWKYHGIPVARAGWFSDMSQIFRHI